MKKVFLFAVAVITGGVCVVQGSDSDLESIMMGARLLYQQNRKAYYMEVGEWQRKHICDNVDNKDALKWAGTGDRVLIATGSSVKVVDIETKDILYERDNLNINRSTNANTAAEISYDAKTIYFVQGNNINAIDIGGNNIWTIFTTSSSNKIREGEFCVSSDGNRFVGRYSNNRAVYIDIAKDLQGDFADECSPAISPSGTRLAVNQGGHREIATYKWELDDNEPSYWRNVTSSVGQWDNHTWSNHEDYYLGRGDPGDAKIVNIRTQDSYSFGHSTNSNYPDLWIPASAGGVVPQQTFSVSKHISSGPSRSHSRTTHKITPLSTSNITVNPGVICIQVLSLTGKIVYSANISQTHSERIIQLPARLTNGAFILVQERMKK
ncbi:MAG: hypothetical protein GF401_19010 [Chitinivibrionales bacterium]|nr:hypothetical protein [Chitinivibrionales bacterium]